MGFSERTGSTHRLADRITELGSLTDTLALDGPVLVVAHDWGGPIALGWAERHREQLAGVVLLNTAVSQPDDASTPPLIAAARSSSVLRTVTQRTRGFLEGTLRLAHPALEASVCEAYRAPYREASRRGGIADFVADIPLENEHPSRATLEQVADDTAALRYVPTLLLWGPRDPVFADRYLRDLQRRLPHANTHRFEVAGHLVIEDSHVAAAVRQFAHDLAAGSTRDLLPHPALLPATTAERRTLWAAIDDRRDDSSVAVVEMGRRGPRRTITWRQLASTVHDLSSGLSAIGVQPEDRVALLVSPGADLTALLYAVWRAGAVPVIADAGLGLNGLRRALRGAAPRHVIGVAKGLSVAKGLNATFISVGGFAPGLRRALGVDYTAVELAQIGRQLPSAPTVPVTAEGAVLFTSGATGPAKGVVYRHGQLEAQRDLIRQTFAIRPDDRLVAAFAPFALYGPALGIASVAPDMDVTRPGTLTARALADAIAAVDASLVFAAPAALRSIVRTADGLDTAQRERCARVRLLLSAGAPVPRETLRAAVSLLGDCEAHTPYGMTEVLPVSDVTLDELESVDMGSGVLVGRPIAGMQVAVSPIDSSGDASAPLSDAADVTGEICVRGPHVKDRYDQLWLTERRSARDHGWHRTGDVGHLDEQGRLWVEGRLVHVVTTPNGVLTPVGPEQRIERLDAVDLAAVVGVGPSQRQVPVAVIEAPAHPRGVASLALTDAVRRAAQVEFAAVLVTDELPVDIRHNSKIDRSRVAAWASEVLAGSGDRSP
jgi:acyl-coenzyme A synthetase/AMP-(fatty) acid ligase/pimeloyl-ACP methyl ester carboxylesterase